MYNWQYLLVIVAKSVAIDSDFHDVVCVILTSIFCVEHQIKKGDCISQIAFENCETVKLSEFSE